jgi:hypothetical protein
MRISAPCKDDRSTIDLDEVNGPGRILAPGNYNMPARQIRWLETKIVSVPRADVRRIGSVGGMKVIQRSGDSLVPLLGYAANDMNTQLKTQ